MAEHPFKRTNPADQRKNVQKIIDDMESRLPADSESSASIARRQEKFGSPPNRGGRVTRIRKRPVEPA